MQLEEIVQQCRKLSRPFRVTHGKPFRLKQVDPDDTGDFKAKDRPRAEAALAEGVEAMAALQDRLYAQDRRALLLIFQAMDAAGKDGAIKHVMSGINPQGCQVHAFKTPTSEDLDHDYLWRCSKRLPERGRIGIFNRSYYEETLIVRVHPELLQHQKLPPDLLHRDLWKERFQDIRNFEQYLGHNGIVVRKFFLHVSRDEQRRRFLDRIENPGKNWKFSAADVGERQYWDEYQAAYQDMIRHTATSAAPWYVIPADHKWFTRLVVASAIIETLGSLDLDYPKVSPEQQRELAAARQTLRSE